MSFEYGDALKVHGGKYHMSIMLIGCPLLCFGICLPLFLYYKLRKPLLGAGFKALGTVCAMLPALSAALKLNPVCWLLTAALFLHAVADYLLEIWFPGGMGFFLLGHLCYIFGFLQLFPFTPAHAVLWVCYAACLVYLLWKKRSMIEKNMLPLVVYSLVLAGMSAFGIAGGIASYSLQGILVAAGAVLFPISDLLIFRSLIHPHLPRRNGCIMIIYYAAQLLFGLSCLF